MSICEQIIQELNEDNQNEAREITIGRERIFGEYIALLIQTACDPEHVDRGALLQAKLDLKISDQDFIDQGKAIQNFCHLSEISKNFLNAQNEMIRARERMHNIEAQYKINLQNARHDLGMAEIAYTDAISAGDRMREIGKVFPELFERIGDNFRPRGYCPAEIAASVDAAGKQPADTAVIARPKSLQASMLPANSQPTPPASCPPRSPPKNRRAPRRLKNR
jgi:hypothetical protein